MTASADPQLIEECSKSAVMVRIRGHDSIGVKTLGRPFHKMSGGFTTLSASGLLLDRQLGYVLTSATLLAPYMQGEVLHKGVTIDILTNGLSGIVEDPEIGSKWIPMKLIRILKVDAIHSLLRRFRADSDWMAGWPRQMDSSVQLGEMDLARKESMYNNFWSGYEDVALLQIENESSFASVRAKLAALRRDLNQSTPLLDFNIVDPATLQRGHHLMLVASPYGILSPSVFHNCIYTTMVSNVIHLDQFDGFHAFRSTTNATAAGVMETDSASPPSSSSSSSSSSAPSSSSSSSSSSTSSETTTTTGLHANPLATSFPSNLSPRSSGKSISRRLRSAVMPSSAERFHSTPVTPPSIGNSGGSSSSSSSSSASATTTSTHSAVPSTTPCVILIDQPGLPGCEGAPVFDGRGNLVGLLAPPLRRSDGSNVEVHLVLPIQPFLAQLLRDNTLRTSLKLDRIFAKRSAFKLVPMYAAHPTHPPHFQNEKVALLSPHSIGDASKVLQRALSALVVVSTGSFWGTGVIVSPLGYILTSAHIVRPCLSAQSTPFQPELKHGYQLDVRLDLEDTSERLHVPPPPTFTNPTPIMDDEPLIYRPTGSKRANPQGVSARWFRAKLVYVSSSHLDVALLRFDPPPPNASGAATTTTTTQNSFTQQTSSLHSPSAPSFSSPSHHSPYSPSANTPPTLPYLTISLPPHQSTREPREGEPVIAAGFALFGPSKRIKVTTTSGVISRVANLNGQPKLIQTSASVNKGASGGALLDSEGVFLGLVTCNAMTKEGVIIPKINFSIPANLLTPIEAFIEGGEAAERLAVIERPDPDCAALWSMSALSDDEYEHPQQPQSSSMPNDPNSTSISHPRRFAQAGDGAHQATATTKTATTGTPSNIANQKGAKLVEFWNAHSNLPKIKSIDMIPRARL